MSDSSTLQRRKHSRRAALKLKKSKQSALLKTVLANRVVAALLAAASWLGKSAAVRFWFLEFDNNLPQSAKKTLVLDLDETLIQSTPRGSKHFQFMLEVMVDRRPCLYYTYKRPYLDEFLRKSASLYKLVLYTASMQEYASPVIDFLEASCGTANIDSFLYNYEPFFTKDSDGQAALRIPGARWLKYRYMTSVVHPDGEKLARRAEQKLAGAALTVLDWIPSLSAMWFFVFLLVPFLNLVVSLVLSIIKTIRQQHLARSANAPNLISDRLYRDSCIRHNNSFIKSLDLVASDLSQVALVDNSPNSYTLNQDNGIPVSGWINDPSDEGLLDLIPFLDALSHVSDVRNILSLRA